MTNPSTISDLRAALKELEEKKRKIDEQYRNVAAALRYFEESMGGPHPPPDQPRTSNLGDAIYEILSIERPLHRQEVHDRLKEMGMKIPGRDSVNNVGAHLSLDPRFMSVGRGVWDLADPPQHDESSQPEQFDFDDETDQQGHVLEDDDDQANEEDSLPW